MGHTDKNQTYKVSLHRTTFLVRILLISGKRVLLLHLFLKKGNLKETILTQFMNDYFDDYLSNWVEENDHRKSTHKKLTSD